MCVLLNVLVSYVHVRPAECCCTRAYLNCRQTKAMDGLQDDVVELNSRVKGANQRARRLLWK